MTIESPAGASSAGQRHRVVVVGGGFGGLNVTRGLAKADVDITVIDRTNHHLFQPLLYQVAAGILSARPDRAGAARASSRSRPTSARSSPRCESFDLDAEGRARRGSGRPPRSTLPYDNLVVAAGATHSYFGKDELGRVRPGHEDDRGRPVPARRDPVQVRDGRAGRRPAGAGRVADVRGDRRRPDRRRAGRADRRARAHRAAARLPARSTRRRRRGSSCSRVRRPCCRRSSRSCRSTPTRPSRRWASRST